MKGRIFKTIALLLAGIVVLSGCGVLIIGGAAAAGAGTVLYVKGELKSTEESSLQKAWDATLAAMEDLNFVVVQRQMGDLAARIIARGEADKKISINLTRITDNITEIRIRIGTFGDETLSRLVLEKIKSHI